MSAPTPTDEVVTAVTSWYLPTGVGDVARAVAVVVGLYALGFRDRKLVKTSSVVLGALSAYALFTDEV